MNWLLCVCVLCFLCALGEGQDSNLTLFKIVPCGEVRVDSVSRFKSDIYAVEANLSQCLNVSGALLHDKIVSGAGLSLPFVCVCMMLESLQEYHYLTFGCSTVAEL